MPGVPLSLDVAVAGPVYCQRAVYGHHQSGAVKKKGKRLNGAMWFGKVSTAVFYLVMIVLIAYPPMPPVAAYIMMAVSGFFFFPVAFVLLYIPQYNNLFQGIP